MNAKDVKTTMRKVYDLMFGCFSFGLIIGLAIIDLVYIKDDYFWTYPTIIAVVLLVLDVMLFWRNKK